MPDDEMRPQYDFSSGARGKYYEHARGALVQQIARAIYADDPVPGVAWEQLVPGEYRHARALRHAQLAVNVTHPPLALASGAAPADEKG